MTMEQPEQGFRSVDINDEMEQAFIDYAVSVIVSEETGAVSLAAGGLIVRDIKEESLISKLFEELNSNTKARESGAAIPGIPVTDTVKVVDASSRVTETPDRARLSAVQTPQAFRRDLLVRAYADRNLIREPITDDAQLVEALGHPCKIVEGSRFNLKITTTEDLLVAGALLHAMPKPRREGLVHPFADERTMWGGRPDRPSEDPLS